MKRRVFRVGQVFWIGVGLLVLAPIASAQVTVEGGRNPDNPREFIWTVTNQANQPIVKFEAPHYYGVVFRPPEHWKETESTGNIVKGQKLEPGIIRAETNDPIYAIRRGQTKQFALQLDTKGKAHKRQAVTVEFADGSTRTIEGVLCPAKEPWLNSNIAAIGLGVMFALFLFIRGMRKKASADNAPGTGGDSN